MEERINVAELLKDCPKGMELDCTMFENVTFVRVDMSRKQFPIEIAVSGIRSKYLTKEGCFHDTTLSPESKCVIFPKGKTTWKGFVPSCEFKDGDIVATMSGSWIGITVGGREDKFIPTYCVIKSNGKFEAYFDHKEKWSFKRLATEEEKEKLFKAIKDNGYKWNPETKTLEKFVEPKFKVGDRVRNKNYKDYIYTIQDILSTGYRAKEIDADSPIFIRFGSQEDNYELVPNKFDINTLVPFESRVLVRDYCYGVWRVSLWGCLINHEYGFKYDTIRGPYKQCIPYENNEHLLGKTDDCDEYYKTW